MECIIIEKKKGGLLKKVGYLCMANYDGVEYQQIGALKKFNQTGRSRSLRSARVMIKKMVTEAYAHG